MAAALAPELPRSDVPHATTETVDRADRLAARLAAPVPGVVFAVGPVQLHRLLRLVGAATYIVRSSRRDGDAEEAEDVAR